MRSAPITRDDFDAALVPGFRESTQSEYRALDRAWRETSATVLDAQGAFVPGSDVERDCPLCGAPGAQGQLLFVKLGMRIVRCPGCGLTYSRNVLHERHDRQLYVDSAAQTTYQALKRNQAYAGLERVKCDYIVQSLGELHPGRGKLLDIGPGSGRLLEAAAARGWDAMGIEANAEFAAACRALGLDVVEGFFPEALADEERFDAIALLDVVEHLHDPVALLGACAARLAPGGVIAVQVPNVDSLLVQLEGPRHTTFCHGHWNHFNLATLQRLGRAAGLEPRRAETIITEIDRIRAHPAGDIAAAARRVAGVDPPAGFDSAWMHAHGLGYKALAFFARPDG